MSLKKKLLTWLTVATVGVMPVIGGVGCGWNDTTCAIAVLFSALYDFVAFQDCYFEDGFEARSSYTGTLEMPGVLPDALSLNVDRKSSVAQFQEKDGFTAIGLNDATHKVTIEIVLPGQSGGEWKVTEAQDTIAPYFRVNVGDKTYQSAGADLQLALQNPYPEKGQQYVGKVAGSVVGPDGVAQPVSLEFSATRY